MEKFVMLIHLQSALSALLTRLRNWIERQQFMRGPAADGEPGQVLATNGEGEKIWTTVEASGAAAAAEKAANEYTDRKIEEIPVPDVTEQIEQALAEAKESGEFDGAPGYTPVKGTDYFTEEDKAEIVEDVLAEMPVPDVSGWIKSHNEDPEAHEVIKGQMQEEMLRMLTDLGLVRVASSDGSVLFTDNDNKIYVL